MTRRRNTPTDDDGVSTVRPLTLVLRGAPECRPHPLADLPMPDPTWATSSRIWPTPQRAKKSVTLTHTLRRTKAQCVAGIGAIVALKIGCLAEVGGGTIDILALSL